MNIIQRLFLYSLFMSLCVPFSLVADHEEIIILCGSDEEEIYPIADTDTICTLAEIHDHLDVLEFDPSAQKIETMKKTQQQDEIESPVITIVDITELPVAPDDIVILGQNSLEKAIDEFAAAIDDQVEFATDNTKADSIQDVLMPQKSSLLETQEPIELNNTEPKSIEVVLIEAVIAPAQDNTIDDIPTSKNKTKKEKKGLFSRSKKNKDKK